MGHCLWLPAVAIHRQGVVEIAPSPHHCFRTTHPCAQSVKGSPTEPVLSRSSRQRLGHLQSHFDGDWHVCQAVFPEVQSAAACRRVERRDCAHEALLRLQSASSWLVVEKLVSGICRLSCAFHTVGNSPPGVRRSDICETHVLRDRFCWSEGVVAQDRFYSTTLTFFPGLSLRFPPLSLFPIFCSFLILILSSTSIVAFAFLRPPIPFPVS